MDLPLAHMVEAMVQTLRQLGWSYVSVVRADGEAGVDATADHVRGKDMFVEAAARAGICVALEVGLARRAEVLKGCMREETGVPVRSASSQGDPMP